MIVTELQLAVVVTTFACVAMRTRTAPVRLIVKQVVLDVRDMDVYAAMFVITRLATGVAKLQSPANARQKLTH